MDDGPLEKSDVGLFIVVVGRHMEKGEPVWAYPTEVVYLR